MVKNAAWITPSGKWKFTIERSGRRCAPNCGGDPSQKNSMSSWSEETSGVRCRTIGRYRCRLRGSRYSRLRERFRQPPGRLSRGDLDTAAISPSTPGRARKRWNHFWFPVASPNSVPTLYRRSRVPRGTCGLGFKETERVVYFRKDLNPIDRP
jgi:hypothetical protein